MKRRTKPRSTCSKLLCGSKNVGTQTEDFDSLIEVAKLEEQVKVLQLENNVLRKYAENSNNPDIVHHTFSNLIVTSKSNVEKSSCGCKGNCSSRICGCVKKSNNCDSLCKCDSKICQNQKLEFNQENKENINRTDVQTSKKQSRKRNEAVERTENNKSLFNLDMKELSKELEESEFNDTHFNFRAFEKKHNYQKFTNRFRYY